MMKLFILMVGGIMGIVGTLLIDRRMRRRISELRELMDKAEAIEALERERRRLSADNKKLIGENDRYRKSLVFAAAQTQKLKDLQQQNNELRADVEKRKLQEDARYGALLKFLTMNGFQLTPEQWNEITPK